ncbi:hypothetical protein [Paenibacillus lautus]|uniref:hypothetical protein n=1 Tax=Paenibacillus lautus TaxID=1401 RepID=UPI001C7E005C|nr:hypothetical protein [Paenibacillus lautus]
MLVSGDKRAITDDVDSLVEFYKKSWVFRRNVPWLPWPNSLCHRDRSLPAGDRGSDQTFQR